MLVGLLLLIVLTTALGLALLTLGLRGRRINDHPVCRRCRFDLIGVYPDAARCPECGGELHGPRAVRQGARRRRRGMLLAAAPLLLVGVGGAGAVGWISATSYNWYPHAPASLLEALARSANPARQAAAVGELTTRLTAGELEAARVDALVERGLAVQADRATPWVTQWGGFLSAALGAGAMSESQAIAYMTNGTACELQINDRVRTGEQAMLGVRLSPDRIGPGDSGTVSTKWPTVFLDGEVLIPDTQGGGISAGFLGPGGSTSSSQPVMIEAAEGGHELTATVELVVHLTSMPKSLTISGRTTVQRDLLKTFEVVAPATPLIEFVNGAALAEAMAAGLSVPRIELISEEDGRSMLKVSVRGVDLPVPYAFEMLIRCEDGELRPWYEMRLGTGGKVASSYSGILDGQLGDTADVVLRASERAALMPLGLTTSWGGEMVLEDVPVERPETAEE